MNFNWLRTRWDTGPEPEPEQEPDPEPAIETHNCPICFENIEQLYTKWSCNHYFHENCINTWNHSCPLCRNIDRIQCTISHNDSPIDQPKNNIMNFYSLQSLMQVPTDKRHLYINNWGKPECIDNNHELLVLQPYGVIVICKDCNLIKCFNRLHH